MMDLNLGCCDPGVNCSVKYRKYTTKSKPSYFHCIGEDQLLYRTLGQQLDISSEEFSNSEAIVSYYEGQIYKFSHLRKVVDHVAAGLLRLGLKKGDTLGIWATNSINWYVTWMAAARVGLVSVAINPAFQGPELEFCLTKVCVKAIVAAETFKTQQYYEIIQSICPELKDSKIGNLKSKRLPHLKFVILFSKDRLPGTLKFNDLLEIVGQDDIQQVADMQSEIPVDHPCNIQFTSGTTGHPKATVLTHFNVLNNAFISGRRSEMKDQRICMLSPFFHVYGMVAGMVAALCHGGTLVIPSDGFSPEKSLRATVDEKCTLIFGTPTMYVDMVAISVKNTNKQRELQLPLKTAKIATTGGSACSPKLLKDMQMVLGLRKIKTVFGMTETAVSFQAMVDDDEDKMRNTVGRLLDHMEAKVIDVDGNTVPFGHPGELCIRGYSVMSNYIRDEAKTKEILSESGWLRTGDQFVLYENGYGQIVGRLKEIIIRGGENIFPKEIEDLLSTHHNILETHVIGVDDERLGEEVCAYIRLNDCAKDLTHEDVKQFCRGKIAHFKIPRYVRVVKDFPKTTSGKIQKFKLKEIFEREQNC